MEAATLPAEGAEQDGAPVEEAEATRTTAHLFQWSEYVHAGEGAETCEKGRTGDCKDPGHFHAWVCLPNSIQHRDILEKARAAKARRRRAMRDAGDGTRPASDAFITVESELDDQLAGAGLEAAIDEMANRSVRKGMSDLINEVREDDERYENYYQDAEEWRRLSAMPEDQRPTEEFEALGRMIEEFEKAVESRVEQDLERGKESLRALSPKDFRQVVREARIDAESAEAHVTAYYQWLGFIGTRRVPTTKVVGATRYWTTMEDFRNAPPEAVEAVEEALRDLEGRMQRGDAAGN